MNLNTTKDYISIILNKIPMIDVRAPIEFDKGSFPNTVNLPIMNDQERHLVGTTYKEDGNEAAVALGHHLVSGFNKEQKIEAWRDFITKHPDALIFCFRGGQRSQISQQWIHDDLHLDITRLEGGYKAFRQYILDSFIPENQTYTPIRLGGYTGSAKTVILNELKNSIDLERIARHRGSAFGTEIEPQPTQINFENALAFDLIQKLNEGYKHLIFEDEGRHVGRCYLPQDYSLFVNSSSLVIVDSSFEERSYHILDEYVTKSQQAYVDHYGAESGLGQWLEYILGSMDKAKKKLGGQAHKELVHLAKSAFERQDGLLNNEDHLSWIRIFLKDYYDPMYAYQLEQNKKQIIFRGNRTEVSAYLKSLT